MALKIVSAKKRHLSDILKIWIELMDFHARLNPFFKRKRDGHLIFKKYLEESLTSEDVRVLVAIEGKRIVGYLMMRIGRHPPVLEKERFGFITDLAVQSTRRRQGIGAQLLDEALTWFKMKRVYRVELRVSCDNDIGYSFWRKHGFKDYLHILYREIE
jgi:ribosomal protein S18 acetylase RimI-like enzyme